MIASRLGVPVVPVRIEGLDKVLHHTWKMATPGRVRVAFGAPLDADRRRLRSAARSKSRSAVAGAAEFGHLVNLVIWSLIWTRFGRLIRSR